MKSKSNIFRSRNVVIKDNKKLNVALVNARHASDQHCKKGYLITSLTKLQEETAV